MLLGHARLATIWCEATRRMEPLAFMVRSSYCEVVATLQASMQLGTSIEWYGSKKKVYLENTSSIRIGRHTKIKQEARMYDQKYFKYFSKRKQNSKDRLYRYHLVSKVRLFDERHWS